MTEYLIRLAQEHQSFRRPELEALATLERIDLEFLFYDKHSPFCVVKLKDEAAAKALISRSILAKGIYELWGQGRNYDELHADVRQRTEDKWPIYKNSSFRFAVDGYGGARNIKELPALILTFSYMDFKGPVRMKNPDQEFRIFEEYEGAFSQERSETPGRAPNHASTEKIMEEESTQEPFMIYFGRRIATSGREVVQQYDLKKRNYISTTSMESAMSLLTANMALAAPGKVFYDPFVGTGSFCVAAAHFGAVGMGSDIDGRSFKGKDTGNGKPTGLNANLEQYGFKSHFLDAFAADLTNTPIRSERIFDGIICDPPYGVREGLKVLGSREGRHRGYATVDGVPSHLVEGYIAPKKPYGFEAMLGDILEFASRTLVPNGRLSFWMPTANDDLEIGIPTHPSLEVVSVCIQPFNKWSRRLLTYRRLPDGEVSVAAPRRVKDDPNGKNADDLNSFRRRYFQKFNTPEEQKEEPIHP
ncbi:hypothetical protein FQN54_005722 [Arachnomyces sp. PD_36]|nr:hypothetical protein FQN54_005722 [Arachnomyces sp. PD_36]